MHNSLAFFVMEIRAPQPDDLSCGFPKRSTLRREEQVETLILRSN
jgi:hypothetical protein